MLSFTFGPAAVTPTIAGVCQHVPVYVARTKALPELLGDTRTRLAAAWPSARGG